MSCLWKASILNKVVIKVTFETGVKVVSEQQEPDNFSAGSLSSKETLERCHLALLDHGPMSWLYIAKSSAF